jgi:hypothetical protein
MPTFVQRTALPVSADAAFAWHERPGAFERLNPPFDPVEVVERTGGLEVGSTVRLKANVGPVSQRWTAKHTAYERGRMFRDELVDGPFAKWVHTHRFEPISERSCVLQDEIEYQLPMGAVGAAFGSGFVEQKIAAAFKFRHALTLADLERHARFEGQPRLTIAVTGASGLLASSLIPFLTTGGHTVRAVGRKGDQLDPTAIDGADAVLHLAGAGVADERWTQERKRLLVESRVAYTRQLVEAIRSAARPPKVLVSGSAIGIYGDRGDELLSETAAAQPGPTGPGFLSSLCVDWEREGAAAEALGLRVVLARIGVVLTPRGGAMGKMLTPFRAGVGGPTGTGKQWLSWISSEDTVGALHHVLMTASVRGPVNLCAPNPVTSKTFASALGSALSRPAIAPIPAFVLRAMFGEMADGTVLASQRVSPTVLEATGFTFLHPQLETALRFVLGK